MAFNIDSNYDMVNCCVCKMNFFIPSWYHSNAIKNGSDFFCPSGHALTYKIEEDNKAKKIVDLQEELSAAKKTIETLSKKIKGKKKHA